LKLINAMKKITTFILAIFFICNMTKAQDTLYIYKSGTVLTKYSISEIDSLTFHNALPPALPPVISPDSVADIDGNIYHTVKIGTQIWMIENLKTTKYRDGTSIPYVTDATTWMNLTTGAYCNYNNDQAIAAVYGRLYNWYSVTDVRSIAPIGWHVPTNEDLTLLINYLGGTDLAGAKLKESGTAHWLSPNADSNNLSGFTGLPAGCRWNDMTFTDLGMNVYWWSSTSLSETAAKYLNISNGYSAVYKSAWAKNVGFSVRCVRDN